MILIWGKRMVGKVDSVPRVGYVSTQFFHLYYVPVIPLQSFLVFSQDGDNIHGANLGFHSKSIVVGYLRGLAWLTAIIGPVIALLNINGPDQSAAVAAVVATALAFIMLPVLYLLPWIRRADYDRALQLADQVGLSYDARLMLEVAYGRLNAEQAEAELVRRMELREPTTRSASQ